MEIPGYFECPYCRYVVRDGTEICPACGERQVMAMLVCSHPVGDVPSGMSWALYPRSYTVGTWESDDIVIRDSSLSGEILKLVYSEGRYRPEFPRSSRISRTDVLDNRFRIGTGMLRLNYVSEISYPEYSGIAPRIFGMLPSAFLRMAGADDETEVFRTAVDAVLRMTGLGMGCFLSFRGADEMVLECARSKGMEELDASACEFSGTIIRRASESNDVACIDLESAKVSMSDSMAGLSLRKVLCVPVSGRDGRLIGMIYADMRLDDPAVPDIMLLRPALRVFAKMFAARLEMLHCKDNGTSNK